MRSLPLRRVTVAIASLGGALLLLRVGNAVFTNLVPWLLLTATLVFAYSETIRRLVLKSGETPHWIGVLILVVFSIYGGFFGAGLGVLLLTALILIEGGGIHAANSQKNIYATLVTTNSVVTFIFADLIEWPATLAVMAGALLGGYGGGRLAHKVPAKVLHACIVAIGLGLSAKYLHDAYLAG